MAAKVPHSPRRGSQSFQQVVDAFLGGEGLPFAEILSAERIQRIFAKHGCLFGLHGVYTAGWLGSSPRAPSEANRVADDNRWANDNHRQAEVDDLFAQWASDPLQLLSFPELDA